MPTTKKSLRVERDEARTAGRAVLAYADRLEQRALQTEAAHRLMTDGFLRRIEELEHERDVFKSGEADNALEILTLEAKVEDLQARYDTRGVEIGHLSDMVRERDGTIQDLKNQIMRMDEAHHQSSPN